MTLYLRDLMPRVSSENRRDMMARRHGVSVERYVDQMWEERAAENPHCVRLSAHPESNWPMTIAPVAALPPLGQKIHVLRVQK